MSRFAKPILLFLLGLLPLAAAPQDAKDIAIERQRIAGERSRVEAEFLAAQKVCYQQFAVTGCLNDARARRRDLMSDLRRQEIGLNDLERKQRTAERLRELEEKEAQQRRQQEERAAKGPDQQAGRDQRAADKAQKATQAASSAQARSATKAHKTQGKQEKAAKPGPDVADNERRYEQRMQEAQEHRAKVEERAAQSGKTPRPLPVPP